MVEKKASFHKKFWSIYREVLSVMWPNFTTVKYNLQISNICHHINFQKNKMNRYSIKHLFLKTLQYSQENTCDGGSFSVKMQDFGPVTLLKRDSNTGVFLWILQNFQEHLSWKTSVNGCLNIFLHEGIT